jgi:predicted nuclease with TOPRIM domain
MSKTDAYRAIYESALRENERLQASLHDLQNKYDDLIAERNRLKASRGAVLKAIDLKGRLKAMFERARV